MLPMYSNDIAQEYPGSETITQTNNSGSPLNNIGRNVNDPSTDLKANQSHSQRCTAPIRTELQVDEPNTDLCRVPGPLRLPNSPNSRPVRALSQSLHDITMISFTVTRSDAHIRPMKQQSGGAPTMSNNFRMRDIIESSEGSLITTPVISQMKSFFITY